MITYRTFYCLLKVLNQCDTITCDPHKSGFCPYPAGAICYRNKDLNNFLSVTGDVVYYHGDFNLGDVGIEGSKPGAAACGVLLANKVSNRYQLTISGPLQDGVTSPCQSQK